MDHMRIAGNEPSSVIPGQKEKFKNCGPKVPKDDTLQNVTLIVQLPRRVGRLSF